MRYRIQKMYQIQGLKAGRWENVRGLSYEERAGAVRILKQLRSDQPKYRVDACLCKWADGKLSAGYRIEIKQGRRWYGVKQDETPLIFQTEEKAYEILNRLEEA